MKTIRNCTFETNSSSTHSLVIHNSEGNSNIPEGVEDYNICDNESAEGSLFVGETRKLRYLLGIIASEVCRDADEDNTGLYEKYYSYWGNKSEEGWKRFKDAILNHPWVRAVYDVVKEERNTTIYLYKRHGEFPYFAEGESYDDDFEDILEMLGIPESKMYDEEVLKKAFHNIIFNPNVIIQDIYEEC